MKTLQQFSKKYVSGFIMLLLLMSITYWYIFRNCEVEDLLVIISDSEYKYLIVGVLMVLIYIWLEGVNLHILGQSLGIKVGRIRGFCYACIDIYFCGITPSATGGQPVLAYYMNRDDIPISKSTIIILLYTVMYKIVLLLLSLGVLVVHLDFIRETKVTTFLYVLGIVVNIVIVSVCLLCMYSRKIVKRIVVKTLTLLAKLRLVKQLDNKLNAFYDYLEDYHKSARFMKENRKILLKVAVATFAQRLALFFVGFLVYRSFGLSSLSFLDILSLQVVIAITVDTLPLPGGVGVSEAMFFLLYTKVYNPDFIMPAMVLTRGISFYLMILVCGIVTMGYHIISVKPSKVLKGE